MFSTRLCFTYLVCPLLVLSSSLASRSGPTHVLQATFLLPPAPLSGVHGKVSTKVTPTCTTQRTVLRYEAGESPGQPQSHRARSPPTFTSSLIALRSAGSCWALAHAAIGEDIARPTSRRPVTTARGSLCRPLQLYIIVTTLADWSSSGASLPSMPKSTPLRKDVINKE